MTYDATAPYPRDLIGYGRNPPHAQWPGGARIAVQFVLNYEEGGENAVLHGDAGSEQFLSEMFNPASYPERHMSMEGIYEYGSRVGAWRILREFEKHALTEAYAVPTIWWHRIVVAWKQGNTSRLVREFVALARESTGEGQTSEV